MMINGFGHGAHTHTLICFFIESGVLCKVTSHIINCIDLIIIYEVFIGHSLTNHNYASRSLSFLRCDISTKSIPFIFDSLDRPCRSSSNYKYSGRDIESCYYLHSQHIRPMKINSYKAAVIKHEITESVWFSG